jgi:HopA1 effector protein family
MDKIPRLSVIIPSIISNNIQKDDLNMQHLLREKLEDIATNIEIKDGLTIAHTQYRSLEFPPELKAQIQTLSPDLQTKYLSWQLRSFLYGVYYNGAWRSDLESILLQRRYANDTVDRSNIVGADWENNTFLGMDAQFYDRLKIANHGVGFYDPDWQIMSEEDDGTLKINKHELSLYIDRHRYLQPTEIDAPVGSIVSVKMPHNLIQNGFYIAVSNLGSFNKSLSPPDSQIVRFYFNITTDGAIALMEALTIELNLAQVPFNFKVLYNPTDYNRYDPGVLYIQRSYYHTVHLILERIYPQHQEHFKSEIPLFTKQIAPGLAIAEEPDRKFGEAESFGLNRCQIVANALIQATNEGDSTPETKLAAIVRAFDKMGISLEYPFLNADAVDIYSVLNLS